MTTERWYISPEVAGELGDRAVLDSSVHPPVVHRFHHHFQGWLGDDLLAAFPCFLITSRLAKALKVSELSGFELAPVEVSVSSEFEELYPGRVLPEFQWLKATGRGPHADFRLSPDFRLDISDRALELLRRFNINNALLEPAPSP